MMATVPTMVIRSWVSKHAGPGPRVIR
jgi:hypothetical protein